MSMGLQNISEVTMDRSLLKKIAENHTKTLYIDAGSPWQNGFIESFNARLREECLNREQLWILTEARVVIDDWRWKYNKLSSASFTGLRPLYGPALTCCMNLNKC